MLVYGLPISSSAVLIRLSDQSQLDLDRTPLDYQLSDGEQLRVVDRGATLSESQPLLPPARRSSHPSGAGPAEAERPTAEKEVADAVHALVERVARDDQQRPDDTAMTE